ncbi:MAG: sugar ABC transporter substrate-binding protein [Devosia sp.]|nr:sugar ABC transporter substrate-binding protein [Devosia sp.]
MERRTFLKLTGATALAGALTRPAVAADTTVRWWYHFDNPQASPAELIAKFEAANPGIKIAAENIPWGGGNDYYTRLFAAIVAGSAPDCAMVKLNNQARLLEMQALEPIDKMIAAWDARADISDNIWSVNKASDGHQYYLPLQYVVIYLYYRVDMFAAAGLQPPTTFDAFLAAAKALTKDGVFGFGMRGGAGGYDNWGPFVLGGGANFAKGGMISDAALTANRFYVGLGTEQKVIPPSAPTDGFKQIVANFQSGRTAMAIHHVGSSNDMAKALGDKVSAVPVPHGPDGKGWTLYGDESNAVLAASANKEAAFKWISFLSTGDNNAAFNALTGQLSVTTSGAAKDTIHQPRFVAASTASLPMAGVLPDSAKTADFTGTVWPTNMQQALLGQITPDAMMRAIETLYNG